MELCGMFPETMIDKSRKKEHYFDTDYSPFLIEDPTYGILRIPESRQIEEAIPSNDPLFLDFVAQCLILDPDVRPGAAEAMKHPWITGEGVEFGCSEMMQETEFDCGEQPIPTMPSVLYQPLRKKPEKKNSEQLDLSNNMLILAQRGPEDCNTLEYYDGRVSGTDRASLEMIPQASRF